MESGKNRLEWLALVRGFTILLVVMFHVRLIDLSTGENHSTFQLLTYIFNPIRMPLFIFISGGLLYLSRISKNIQVFELYKDKARRILLPLVFFVIVYYVVKLLMSSIVKTPVDFSFSYFLECFYLFDGHASAPLWFLATLSVLMLLYPLFRYLLRYDSLTWIFWLFTVLFYYYDLRSLTEENYYNIMRLNRYLVFFYSGIVFFRYKLYKYTNNWLVVLILVLVYSILSVIESGLFSSFVGIVMFISFSQLIANIKTGIFSSFRDYIYQIYLMSFFFQGLVELVLWKHLFYNEHLFFFFYVMNIIIGLYCPVVVSKCIERCPLQWIRYCFGLSR